MPTANELYQQAKTAGNVSFAAEWGRTQSQLAKLSAGERVSQLGYSSLDPGEFVMAYDALGQARMRIGHQSDGTVALIYGNGPPPPVPTTPVVSARQLSVFVYWDGEFSGGYKRPGDVLRVDVHMADTAGFIPDGTTVVGQIPFEGGITITADNTTHYIKIVAVTTSDVASAPTAGVAVLPLPAGQIAAGAIGADQLAVNIALVSRLIAGDPSAARLELDGRPGVSPNLSLYDPSGNRTMQLDATTGSVYIKGQIRTADSGERMVLRETASANDLRFYPSTGSAYARLYAQGFPMADGNLYGGILMQSPTYNNRRSFIWSTPDQVACFRGTTDGSLSWGGHLALNDSVATLRYYSTAVANGTPSSALNCFPNQAALSVGASASLGLDTNGFFYNATTAIGQLFLTATSFNYVTAAHNYVRLKLKDFEWRFTFGGSTSPILWETSTNCGLFLATTGVDIYNPSTGAALAIGASAFITKSARETKTDIDDLPFDPVQVIRAAPSAMWERKTDQRDEHGRWKRARKHFGPMADDLPAALQVRTAVDNELGIDIGSNLGVAWAGIARQADQLDDHAARLDELTARLDALAPLE